MKWLWAKTSDGEWVSKEGGRIHMSSRNNDGSYSYSVYRNGKAIAITRNLDEAIKKAEAK